MLQLAVPAAPDAVSAALRLGSR